MTEVNAYPQPHLFEDHLDRILAPTPETRAAFLSPSSEFFRDMSFDPANYYSSPAPAKQPLQQARSASVSSACSSSAASHRSPRSSHHGALSRTLSPASGISEPGTAATAMTTGSGYQQHSYAPQTSLMPSPSQYFSAPIPPPVPLYSPLPNLRHYTPSTSYGYTLGSIPSHPSPLSMQSFPSLDYPSFAPSPYSSAAALQSYHPPHLLQQYPNSVRARPEPPRESMFLKGLQKLPSHVIERIHSSFTYLECWKVYAVCRWFNDRFHPYNLPDDDKIAGVRYAEQYYRRYFPGRATSISADGRTREYDSKHPGCFGCYHCFRIRGPEHFELFKWNNQREDEQDTSDAEPSSTPKQSQLTLPPPPNGLSSSSRNPHYDPTLTRSNMAAAANKNRRASRAGSAGTTCSSSTTTTTATTTATTTTNTNTNKNTSNTSQHGGSMPSTDSPRIKETWGIRRFCIQCGIAKRYYHPGDLIELCKPKEAVWVCQCWKIHKRPAEIKCLDCDSFIPLSTPNRRRG
ncbi:hypothetical protein QBC44DRAFT_332047 [Cladorrhinum sp. PSN332]|nr:hypothetical protein QBC44DRAFT_332047 [Cladorrhinum sp. PSN332]